MYYSMNNILHSADKDISNYNFSKKGGRDEKGQSVIYSFDIERCNYFTYKILQNKEQISVYQVDGTFT